MQSAAIRLLGQKPAAFFGDQSTAFILELCDLVNEVAQDIAKYQDWQALTKIAVLSGDGSSTTVELPYDYDRMVLDSDLQAPQNWAWGYTHFLNLNDFVFDQDRGVNLTPGGWTIYGGNLQFSPAPSGETKFPYITNAWAVGADGTAKIAFTADTDKYLLPERLLTLGLVWRWRENKKLDASGDQEAFIKALDEYAGKDAGSSIIRFGRTRRWPNTVVPYMGYAW
jgi:hypothetical protein